MSGDSTHKLAQDLPLFAALENIDMATVDTTPSPLEDKLQTVKTDAFTLKHALKVLYELVKTGEMQLNDLTNAGKKMSFRQRRKAAVKSQ